MLLLKGGLRRRVRSHHWTRVTKRRLAVSRLLRTFAHGGIGSSDHRTYERPSSESADLAARASNRRCFSVRTTAVGHTMLFGQFSSFRCRFLYRGNQGLSFVRRSDAFALKNLLRL